MGSLLWAQGFGGVTDQEGNYIAVDAGGNVILGGYTSTPIDFGCGSMPSAAGDTPYVVKFGPSGNCVWSHVYTVTQLGITSQTKAVATDPAGNVFLGITFFGGVDVGGGALTSAGTSDVAIAKLDVNGVHQWSKRFGNAFPQTLTAMGADAAGNVIATGYFAGSVDFGGGPLNTAGSNDIFVVKLSPTGAHLWSKRFGDSSNQVASALAVDAAGNVLVSGGLGGTVDFGGGPLTSIGLGDAFALKLDPNGNHVWSKTFASTADDGASAIGADAAGNVLVTGFFSGPMITLGAQTYTNQGSNEVFLVKLDPAGNFVWTKVMGGPGSQGALAVTADPSGNVIFGGLFDQSMDLGGGALTSAGSSDVYLAKYTPSGSFLWAKQYGSVNFDLMRSLATDASGNVFFAGFCNAPVDFGGGPVAGYGGEDVFIAKLTP